MLHREVVARVTSLPLLVMTGAFILFWEVSVTARPELAFLFGKPREIALSAPAIVMQRETVIAFLWTSSAAITGLFLGTLFGTLIALLSSLSRIVASIAHPYMKFAASLPLLALAPLFTFWCGIDWPAKVMLSAFACMFLAFEQALFGALQARSMLNPALQQSSKLNAVSLVRYVLLPGAQEQIKRGVHLNIAIAITAVIMGEFIASEHGLGHLLLQSLGVYKLSEAWVVLMLIVIAHKVVSVVAASVVLLRCLWGSVLPRGEPRNIISEILSTIVMILTGKFTTEVQRTQRKNES